MISTSMPKFVNITDIKEKNSKNRCLKNSSIFKSFIANLLYKRFEIVNPDLQKYINTR